MHLNHCSDVWVPTEDTIISIPDQMSELQAPVITPERLDSIFTLNDSVLQFINGVYAEDTLNRLQIDGNNCHPPTPTPCVPLENNRVDDGINDDREQPIFLPYCPEERRMVEVETHVDGIGTTVNVNEPAACPPCCSVDRRVGHEYMYPPAPTQMSSIQQHEESHGVSANNVNTTSNRIGGPSMTAQSVAARQRRRKISNKTQELGKLIPGGRKMNTAEMFLSAAKYIKFLQAEVGMLSLMNVEDECMRKEEEEERMGIRQLLTSSAVEEKLYRAEKCIVPKTVVDGLDKDPSILSDPFISRDFRRFLKSLDPPRSSII